MSKHLLRVALYLDLSEVVWNFCLPSFIKTVKAAGFKVGLFGEPYLCVAVLPLATLRLWALRLAYVCLYACLVSAVALVLPQGVAVFLAYCVVAAAAKFTQQAHSASCRLCTLGCVFGATSFVISYAAAVVMAAFVAVCPTYWLWWPTRLPESEVEQKLLDLEAWVIDNQDYLRSRNGVTLRAKLDQRKRNHKIFRSFIDRHYNRFREPLCAPIWERIKVLILESGGQKGSPNADAAAVPGTPSKRPRVEQHTGASSSTAASGSMTPIAFGKRAGEPSDLVVNATAQAKRHHRE